MNDIGIFETIYSARAIRRFKSDPVPDAIISRILDAAIRAPSAGNSQDWLFIVITDAGQRQKVGDIYRRASMWVRQVYKTNPPSDANRPQYERMLKSGFYLHEHMADAPVLIVPCLRLRHDVPDSLPEEARSAIVREFAWRAGASIYPAVQNIILACRALGLGTVLTTNHMLLQDEMKQVLGLPADVMTFGLMPIRYPLGKFRPVVRKPIAEIAFRDRFPRGWQEE